jgi:hypothetical protein
MNAFHTLNSRSNRSTNSPHWAEEVLDANPDLRLRLRIIAKFFCGSDPNSFSRQENLLVRTVVSGGSEPGASSRATLDHPDICNGVSEYAASRDFLVPVEGGITKLLTISAIADSVALKPASEGVQITEDASMTGTFGTAELGTIAVLKPFSGSALEDSKFSFEPAILECIIQGVAYRMDWCAFRADGSDDATDGTFTGIFANGTVPNVSAGTGNTSVAKLDSDDFANAIAAVATALRWNRAFQRGGLASLMPPKPQVKPSPLDRLGIGPEIIRAVELIAVQIGNTVKAWRSFAASSRCPEHLRYLATGDIPEALRAAVRFHVIPAVVMIGREWACLRLDLPEPSPCRPAYTFGGPRHD